MEPMKYVGRMTGFCALWLTAMWLAGCADPKVYNPTGLSTTAIPELLGSQTGTSSVEKGYKLRVGDELLVTFPDMRDVQPMTDQIREDGFITLVYNQKFEALGKTIVELQTNIHNAYVPKIFTYLTVNIKIQNRSYSIGGEVRSPNSYPYAGQVKLLEAINQAGGLTDFAKHGAIQITRASGERFTVDYDKARRDSKLNPEIFPGDTIYVDKRWL